MYERQCGEGCVVVGSTERGSPIALTVAAVLAGQANQPTAQAAVADDLAGLSPADREKFQSVDVHTHEQRVKEAYRLITELADRYTDSFAVQQKACELGMAFRVQPEFIVRYCGRMSELQMAAQKQHLNMK